MTPAPEAPPPQQMIVTTYGLYCRGTREYITIADLITLLEGAGAAPPAVRSAVSRLKKGGVLLHRRVAGTTAYAPSPRLDDVFMEGDERIFHPRRAAPDDPWLLVAFSVPESRRHLRHRIRTILGKWGAGTVVPGVWILPDLHAELIRAELDREELLGLTDFFRARTWSEDELRERIHTWWDLPALAARYTEFIDQWQPQLERVDLVDDAAAFASYVTVLTQWRRLPYLDPGLPLEYLPDGWPAQRAADLMQAVARGLSPASDAYVARVLDTRG